MRSRLDLTEQQTRQLGAEALELVAEYYRELPARRIMPDTTSRAVRQLLEEPLPRAGTDAGRLLETVRDVILPFSRHNGHPRFFGYVASPGSAVSAVGELIASALNSNVTSWRSAPAGAELEHVVINWFKEMLGYPTEAGGLLVSGGSMANFAALAAARTAKAGAGVSRDGMMGARRLRIYVSGETHFSVRKAATMLGIGTDNVREVGTDEFFRMDTRDLERQIGEDAEAGYLPACVVANAGTTACGAFDPLGQIAAVASRYGLWFHVDAAYGGFAALAPSARHLFSGIAEADSVSLDPHKWLYASAGCGSILYRNPAAARAAFAHEADYINPLGVERDEAFAFWNYGPELSRRFRALNVWMLIKHAGAEALGEAIERNMACARYFEGLVRRSPDFEMLAPVGLSVFCFRYRPPGFEGDLDLLNQRLMLQLQRGGASYVSNANIRGRFALRGCVLNYRTAEADMETLLEDLRHTAASLGF